MRESTHQGDYFWIRIEVKQLPRELRSRPRIACFREDLNCAAQCNLQMWGLEFAVGKVRREFKTPLNIVRVFLRTAPALKLNRYTEQIFTSGGHGTTPLKQS
jgi:hypothetical protein